MYFDFHVKIPENTGRISLNKRKGTTYVEYTYGRKYIPEKRYNVPQRTTIGKMDPDDPSQMFPNPNFIKYFPEVELPEEKDRSNRSSCLRIGGYIVIKNVIENYKLDEMMARIIGRDSGLFLDLAAYSIITENNAGQYYPDYGYNHPLFTSGMRIYSDSKVSDFITNITQDQSIGFLNEWNASRNHREKIYISYDSTNKACQAGDIEIAEFGHSKDGKDYPVFNYSVAYDRNNREPLFYEEYPGSIVDMTQLQIMLEKAKGYGYKKAGFILDRGYFSKANIRFMDKNGYDFVIMVKGMKKLIREIILDFTPLLDVTLIILFYFILFSHMGAAEAQQKADRERADAAAAQTAAAQHMEEAEQLMQQAEFERRLLAEAGGNGAMLEQAVEEYAAGRNIKLLLTMNGKSWTLRVRRGNARDTLAELHSAEDLSLLTAALRKADYQKDDIILCELIYDADEDGTNQAYQDVRQILEQVREAFPHIYISETDLSK